jgi:hypothetical protein
MHSIGTGCKLEEIGKDGCWQVLVSLCERFGKVVHVQESLYERFGKVVCAGFIM